MMCRTGDEQESDAVSEDKATDDPTLFSALLEDSAEDLCENAPCGYLSTLLERLPGPGRLEDGLASRTKGGRSPGDEDDDGDRGGEAGVVLDPDVDAVQAAAAGLRCALDPVPQAARTPLPRPGVAELVAASPVSVQGGGPAAAAG
ncbi:hypothetical protein [Streptomyces sp. NPDC054958]